MAKKAKKAAKKKVAKKAKKAAKKKK